VWGVVAAHRGTSEFSAQAVGRTLAALVEAGRRGGVVVAEEGRRWWEGEVPVLNASVRQDSLGVVAGRMAGLEGVVGRWFEFDAGIEGEGGEGDAEEGSDGS